jgi:hypothetical protein
MYTENSPDSKMFCSDVAAGRLFPSRALDAQNILNLTYVIQGMSLRHRNYTGPVLLLCYPAVQPLTQETCQFNTKHVSLSSTVPSCHRPWLSRHPNLISLNNTTLMRNKTVRITLASGMWRCVISKSLLMFRKNTLPLSSESKSTHQPHIQNQQSRLPFRLYRPVQTTYMQQRMRKGDQVVKSSGQRCHCRSRSFETEECFAKQMSEWSELSAGSERIQW